MVIRPADMEEIVGFFRRLDENNTREWFDAHRSEWTHVKALAAKLTEELIEGIAAFDPTVRGLRVQDCTYRIARDTRFSNDKSPYKNWLGIFVAPKGKKSGYAGYYLHIAPKGDRMIGEHMLISGIYCPEPLLLRSVREEILDNGTELQKPSTRPKDSGSTRTTNSNAYRRDFRPTANTQSC